MSAAPTETVSVVIPTYNRLALLPAAVDSALAQSHAVTEIIIVDDGSSDDTIIWVKEAAKADGRIKLIERSHGGANRARNAGVTTASGEWIAFLDSDDEWEPDKLELQFERLRSDPELIALFTGFRLVGGPQERIFLPRDDPSVIDLRCSNQLSGTSSALIRADVLRNVGGFDPDLPSCQDWDLWNRLRGHGRFGVVRKPLVRFNSGPHDRITTNLPKVLAGHATLYQRLREGIDDRSELRRISAAHLLVTADLHRRHDDAGTGLKLAVKSLVTRPSKWAARSAIQAGMALLRSAFMRRTYPRSASQTP